MNSLAAVTRSLRLLSSRDRSLLIIASLLQSGLALLDLAAVLLIGLVVSQAFEEPAVESVVTVTVPGPWPLTLNDVSIIALAVCAGVLLVAKSLLSLGVSRRIYKFLANRQAIVAAGLADRLLHQPLLEIQRRASQETVFALGGGVLAATVNTLGPATVIFSEIVLTIVMAIGLFAVDPFVAVFAIAFFSILAVILQMSTGRWAYALGVRGAQAEIASSSAVQHALRAYREVSVAGRQSLFVTRFSDERWRAAKVQADYFVLSQITKYTFEIGLVIGGALLVGILASTQGLGTAMGTLSVFLLAAARVFPSILRAQGMANSLRNSEGLADTTFRLIDDLDSADRLWGPSPRRVCNASPNLGTRMPRYVGFEPTITMRNATFTYPGAHHPVFQDVSVDVEAGSSLALVGPTGAGKSTLADVILGLIDADTGSVRISQLSPKDAVCRWPGAIAYVPQDVAILTGTIRDNVALGFAARDIDDDMVWTSLEQAHLRDFLATQRAGLETVVGEHGVKLSGGQRQRLGIARALYSQPKLIVFDEATSALDAATEAQIGTMLHELSGEVTTVVIAHRLATVRAADQIMYLADGQVQGLGRFDEVRKQVPDFDKQSRLLGL